jgi:hypothetical protein
MDRKFTPILLGVSALGLSMLACEPVFAIGLDELFIIFILFAILLGWPLLKMIQNRMNAQKKKKKPK